MTLRTTVACCGNAEAGDDGFGPAVAAVLTSWGTSSITVIDLGLSPARLLDVLSGCGALCIVDAARADDMPGQLIDLDWFSPRRPALMHDRPASTHALSIADQIDLAQQLHLLPRHVHLVAATISESCPGEPMSPVLRELVPTAAERIVRWAAAISPKRTKGGLPCC